MSFNPEIIVVPNIEELSHRAAEELVALAIKTVQEKGFFTVALSGGTTPQWLYKVLAGERYRNQVPWPHVHLFWGDERCVPPDHPDSNYRMARELLIGNIPIPERNIYRMPAELDNPERAAMEYERIITSFFHLSPSALPRFDLVILGMGDDGHTASLFPETAVLKEDKRLVFANYVEKLGKYRLTLTVPVINQAAHIFFLISGASKALVLKEVLEGKYQPQKLPSQFIRPVNGRLLFLVDSRAAGMLSI